VGSSRGPGPGEPPVRAAGLMATAPPSAGGGPGAAVPRVAVEGPVPAEGGAEPWPGCGCREGEAERGAGGVDGAAGPGEKREREAAEGWEAGGESRGQKNRRLERGGRPEGASRGQKGPCLLASSLSLSLFPALFIPLISKGYPETFAYLGRAAGGFRQRGPGYV